MWICCSFAMSGLRVPRNQRQLYFLIPGQFEGKIGSISFWRWGTNLLIMPCQLINFLVYKATGVQVMRHLFDAFEGLFHMPLKQAITEFLEIQVKHAMQKAPLNNKLSRFDRHDLGGLLISLTLSNTGPDRPGLPTKANFSQV
uniref:Uncharacterized protein n=1 Tax=Oryza punctata TaxID=4537 RepID=A0A0E0JZ88_ORYPU